MIDLETASAHLSTMLWRVLLTLVAMLAAVQAMAEPPAPGRATWFGLHFIDRSTEGALNPARPDEAARVAMAEALIADDLTARGFTLIAPPADAVAQIKNPAKSNGRDTEIARAQGADYAIAGEVHKVSNLILQLNLQFRDAQTGQMRAAGVVDIRGNNDRSFQRGYRYLLKYIIFKEEIPTR